MSSFASPNVQWWGTHALHHVFRDTPPPAEARCEVMASATRDQRVGVQVMLRAQTVERVERVACSPLRRQEGGGAIPAAAFRYAFVEYHRVNKNSTATSEKEPVRKAPADLPDGLPDEMSIALQPEQNQPIYVQWRVPVNAPAGEHRGTVTVRLPI